jgi:hypothetical protein
LNRPDKGVVLRYLIATCGYGRAQLTRLLARVLDGQSLYKRYRAPAHAFARRYTPADALLLAGLDRTHGTMSGPAATVHLLRRALHVHGDTRFERLANLPKSNSAGMEFNADSRLSNGWSYKLGGNYFYNQIDATALGASGLKSSTGLNLKLSLDFHSSGLDTAQASLSRSDKRLTPQGYVDAINQLNLGYRHKLEDDQSLFVTLSDVFNGQRFERYVNTSNMTHTYMRSQRGRVIYVG